MSFMQHDDSDPADNNPEEATIPVTLTDGSHGQTRLPIPHRVYGHYTPKPIPHGMAKLVDFFE